MRKKMLTVALLFPMALSAQQKISGKVSSMEKGGVIPGATILAKSLNGEVRKTSSDKQGYFRFETEERIVEMRVSALGMLDTLIKPADQSYFELKLRTAAIELDGVVVTALNLKREARSLSYATQGVDTKSLTENPSPNFIASLSGKVAGVQIVPPGMNTGSARVVIRGNSSLTGNNQPLFVVDGMPIDNAPGDGNLDYGNNAADVNPNDIADIQVLKGPNAAALYGSKAANGVILITTKQAKGDGKIKFNLNSSGQMQVINEFPEYQDSYGVGTSFYIDNRNKIPQAAVNYRSWGSPMLGQPYIGIDGKEKPYLPQPDNVSGFYKNAYLWSNSLSVEGGNSNTTTYRIAYSDTRNNSVVSGFNEMTKNNIDLKMANNIGQRIKINSKITFLRQGVENRQYSNSNGRNPTNLYTHMARSTDLGELIPYKDPLTGMEIGTHRNFSNPYWVINENPNEDQKDRLIASIQPEVKFTDYLKAIGRLSTDMYWWKGYEFNNIGSVIANNPDGFLRTFNADQQNYNLEGILAFNKSIVTDFTINANLGASSFSTNYERRETRVNALLQPGLINLSNAKEFPVATQHRTASRVNSVFASASLGYKNFAFIDLTGRNDWSSTLPAGNNSYFYPSIGTSLVLTDMLNIKSNWLNFAKLRASYAVVGNDTSPYNIAQSYSFNGFFDGAPIGEVSKTMKNPNLKPERTGSLEIGTELTFLKNRLSWDLSYYDASTTDQIVTAQLPSSSGFERRIYNAGEIRNWGVESSISAKLIQQSDFDWSLSLNYAKNNSKVVSLVDGVDRFQLNNYSSYLYVFAEVGKPYAYMRGLGVARDDQGRMLIEDGGNLLVKDNDKALGSATPDWLGSVGNTFRYKNLSLSLFLDIKKGGMLYSRSISAMLTNGVLKETLYGRDDYYKHSIIFGENASELSGGAIWDAYKADGSKNTQYVSPQNYEYARPNFADFVMYDASFVKLREVALGFQVPKKWMHRMPVHSAKLSVTARDIWTIYKLTPQGIDPEASSTSGNGQGIENGSLPPNSIFGFNLNINF